MVSAASGTADGEAFAVQGMTGVDLSLLIAGPGSRSYAFLIDWQIRVLLAIAWLVSGLLLAGVGLRITHGTGAWTVAAVVGPPFIIYLLYHPIVELLMRGQTPGKRIAGVRIVSRDGGPPGVGAILIRNAFRLIDSLPLLYVVGLMCTFLTEQRVRIGDMAAGTLLVVHDADAGKAIDRLASHGNIHGLDPGALDLLEQLLTRWNEMNMGRRDDIARALLQRIDPNPPQSLTDLSDAALRARLLALSGSAGSR